MTEISQLSKEDIFIVNHLAHQIFPETYASILEQEQLDYMLEWMYNIQTLEEQVQTGHLFYLITFNGIPSGFIGLEPNFPDADQLRIHKLYVLSNVHKQGLGRKLIDFSIDLGHSIGMQSLHLCVNKFNPAVHFYQHIGFNILRQEDFKIGRGYLMEDFVMEKVI